MKRFAPLALFLAAAGTAGAQSDVAGQLKTAREAYEKSNTELAKNLFATIIASRQQVTQEQRVTAYKYLGGYWSLQSTPGARDSANAFFIAAIDYDPFTDLDRNVFAADEQNAFARARLALFKVGIAPVESKALDPTSQNPDSSRYTFRVVSTHNARMTATIVKLNDQANTQEVIATMGNTEGVRDVVWNGLINNVRADTGVYELRLDATDNIRQGTPQQTERQRFRIDHVHARLEDTLPAFRDVNLGGIDTLRSRRSAATPYSNAAKGAFVAMLAGGLPYIALTPTQRAKMSGWKGQYFLGIVVGLGSAGGGWLYANSHKDDARAVAENARRTGERARFNAGVVARNRTRLDKTILIIRPLTSAGISG